MAEDYSEMLHQYKTKRDKGSDEQEYELSHRRNRGDNIEGRDRPSSHRKTKSRERTGDPHRSSTRQKRRDSHSDESHHR